MLTIKDLIINLREDDRIILKDFYFVLNYGDKVGLIGEEGNGKSLLLKAIVNRKEIESYCDVSGNIYKSNEIIAYLPQSLDKKYW
ncbi:ATP-binding cassette domain-containing protein [Aedoeadaptatus coxii]|uniref:ATP-binding cassette domain-containing protein n=1 Tax=Aedoeadaptatus coxii TaxID=755172 RepID=UPI002AD1FE99|nr:ATP-binding cassette domain-containing protein [Peptoniphilus coxii]